MKGFGTRMKAAGLSQQDLVSSMCGEALRHDHGPLRGLGHFGLTLPAVLWCWQISLRWASGSATPVLPAWVLAPLHQRVLPEGGQMCPPTPQRGSAEWHVRSAARAVPQTPPLAPIPESAEAPC